MSYVSDAGGSGASRVVIARDQTKAYVAVCTPLACGYGNGSADPTTNVAATETTDPMTSLSYLGTTYTYDSSYNQVSNLASLAGTWYGRLDGYNGGSSNTLVIKADGTFTETNTSGGAACQGEGYFQLIDAHYNAYDFGVTFTGDGCSVGYANSPTTIGIAFIDTKTTLPPNTNAAMRVGFVLENGSVVYGSEYRNN